MGRKWTDKDIECLRELYPSSSISVVESELQRTWCGIKQKAQDIGVTRKCSTTGFRGDLSADFIDLTGEVFGNVLAFCFELRTDASGWYCECLCGRVCWIRSSQLYLGKRNSCGPCVRIEQGKLKRLTSLADHVRRKHGDYRRGAAERGLEFHIPIDIFGLLITSPCWYCGCLKYSTGDKFQSNGIDRVDNSVGYIPGNLVSCCTICNFAKRDMEPDQFIDWIRKAYLTLRGRGVFRDGFRMLIKK